MGSGPAVGVLLDLVDEGFDRRSWHGTNLRGALRGLPVARAVWRPGRERHNIWEIVTHAAYWKYAVRRRLTGEKRGSFALPGSDFFPAPKRGTQTAWRDNVALLTSEHRLLRAAVAGLGCPRDRAFFCARCHASDPPSTRTHPVTKDRFMVTLQSQEVTRCEPLPYGRGSDPRRDRKGAVPSTANRRPACVALEFSRRSGCGTVSG